MDKTKTAVILCIVILALVAFVAYKLCSKKTENGVQTQTPIVKPTTEETPAEN